MPDKTPLQLAPRRAILQYKPLSTPLPVYVQHNVNEAEITIAMALTEMTIMRSATPDSRYVELLSRRLALIPLLDSTLYAIKALAERAVREGETRLPDYGTILAARPIREAYTDWELEQMERSEAQ